MENMIGINHPGYDQVNILNVYLLGVSESEVLEPVVGMHCYFMAYALYREIGGETDLRLKQKYDADTKPKRKKRQPEFYRGEANGEFAIEAHSISTEAHIRELEEKVRGDHADIADTAVIMSMYLLRVGPNDSTVRPTGREEPYHQGPGINGSA